MAGPGHNYPLTSQGSLPGPMMSSQGSVSGGTYSPQVGGISHQQSFQQQQPASQPQPQMMSPTKSVNVVSLCRMGQETNHELVQKLLDVFKHLKVMQLPNGTNTQLYQDKRVKIEESLRQLGMIFKKLRVIYEKVNEVSDPEEPPEEVLIPLMGQVVENYNINSDAYRYISEEHKQIVEQIHGRNQQIKEIIDKIRTIIWEINTMIVMRKT